MSPLSRCFCITATKCCYIASIARLCITATTRGFIAAITCSGTTTITRGNLVASSRSCMVAIMLRLHRRYHTRLERRYLAVAALPQSRAAAAPRRALLHRRDQAASPLSLASTRLIAAAAPFTRYSSIRRDGECAGLAAASRLRLPQSAVPPLTRNHGCVDATTLLLHSRYRSATITLGQNYLNHVLLLRRDRPPNASPLPRRY